MDYVGFFHRVCVPGFIQGGPWSDSAPHLVQTRVVRAVSWSLLFRVCSSLRDVQDATLWRYNTTFVSCYLGVVHLRLLDVFARFGRRCEVCGPCLLDVVDVVGGPVFLWLWSCCCPPDLLWPLILALEVLVCPPALALHRLALASGRGRCVWCGLLGSLKWPARVPLLSCLRVGGSQIALVSLAHSIKRFPLAVTASHYLRS